MEGHGRPAFETHERKQNRQPGHAAADWNLGFKIKQVTIVSRVIQVQ